MTEIFVSSQSLAVSTAAVSLTVPSPTPSPITRVEIQVQDADIRSQADSAPTTTAGRQHSEGAIFEVTKQAVMASIKFIRDDAVDALLFIDYYREM